MTNDYAENVRDALKLWEEGLITAAELEYRITLLSFDPISWLEQGKEIERFASCCCSSHEPEKTFNVTVTIKPHGYVVKRCQ